MRLGVTIVRATVRRDNTGSTIELPVLLGPDGVIEPVVRYQVTRSARSFSWHRRLCHAIQLLLDYEAYGADEHQPLHDRLQSFQVKLLAGTAGIDGMDPSGLFWRSRTIDEGNALLLHISQFAKWLAERYEVPDLNAPQVDAARHEHFLARAAWTYRNKQWLLGHTQSQELAAAEIAKRSWLARERSVQVDRSDPPRFPHSHFWRLVTQGFVAYPNVADRILRLDLRCVLITLLQHGGGVRTSECFHLWFADVQRDPIDPSQALVRIGHPTEGLIVDKSERGLVQTITRAEYLQRHGLKARNRILGKMHAGWKQPRTGAGKFVHVYWRSPVYGRLFLHVWMRYLHTLKSLNLGPKDPWAFVNLRHNVAAPYKISKYREAHNTAVRRIGLLPKKADGTTPHGHRHAYLGWGADAGMSRLTIQKMAHHKSIDSQNVYTAPSVKKIREDVALANGRLACDSAEEIAALAATLSIEPSVLLDSPK